MGALRIGMLSMEALGAWVVLWKLKELEWFLCKHWVLGGFYGSLACWVVSMEAVRGGLLRARGDSKELIY